MAGNKAGMICFDMHVHSEYSGDCRTKVADILKRAGELGIGLAIADHNEVGGSVKACRLSKGIVIPAVEVTCREGFDLLFYFEDSRDLKRFYDGNVKDHRKKNVLGSCRRPGLDLIKAARRFRCRIAFAHPYRPNPKRLFSFIFKWDVFRQMLRSVDMIECINGRSPRFLNRMSINTARRLGKGVVAGSDSHSIRRIGHATVCTNRKKAGSVKQVLATLCKAKPKVDWKNKMIIVR